LRPPTAGGINVTAAISAPAGWNTLTLDTGGRVQEAGSLTVPNLRVSSAGDQSVFATGNNKVGVLASDCVFGLIFQTGGTLVVGQVDGDTGVVITNGNAQLRADDIDIQQPINVSATANVSAGSGQLDLGGPGGPGVLGLSDSELGRITAGLSWLTAAR
jgi:hypothetical protein